jgi:hypothetical protein
MGNVLGRPQPNVRRIKVGLFFLIGLYFVRRWAHTAPGFVRRFNELTGANQRSCC